MKNLLLCLFLILMSQVSHSGTAQCSALFNVKQIEKNADTTALGLLVEHTQKPKKLVLSFIDYKEPLISIRFQILKEYILNNPSAELVLMIYDEHTKTEISDFISKSKPDFNLEKIKFVKSETFGDAVWTRDFSPVAFTDKQGKTKSFIFNYNRGGEDYLKDQVLLAKSLNLPTEKINLNLEGGNLLTDEAGRLYVSVAAIENNLNAGFTKTDYEARKSEFEDIFLNKMAVKDVVWLPRVLYELEGTGHVDMYIRFLSDNNVVVASSKNKKINETLNQIAKIVSEKGFNVHRIQANTKMVNRFVQKNIFPSYTNSILIGKTIFIPKFGVVEDVAAATTYEKLGYKVIQISGESIHFGGSIHCMTYLYP
jgi:agmatine/peptidylarginine deiminase